MTVQVGNDIPKRIRPLLVGVEWCEDVPGGLNRYVHDLHTALVRADSRPRTLITGPMAKRVAGVRAVSSRFAPLPVRLSRLAVAARHLGRACNVVDVHFALTAMPVLAALRRHPVVVHFHGPWTEESRSNGQRNPVVLAVKAEIERLVYRRATRVIVLSDAFRRLLVDRYGVAGSRIEVVRPGVDLDRFKPGDTAVARRHLGLPLDAFVVLSVRRLVPRVGLGDLLHAWAGSGLAQQGGILLVAGDGPERDALHRRGAEQGLCDSVRFLGRVPDSELAECYRAADVSVVPSVELEGYGLVVLESLACGTPVIGTDVGGLPEVLRDLQPDLVVPPAQPAQLAARLADAASGNRALPSRSVCRQYARGYGWDAVVDRHLQVYREAVGAPPGRPSVVFLDHCALPSGAELALSRLLPALTRDVDAHVILGQSGPLEERLRSAGVSVEVLPLPPAAGGLRRDRVRGTLAAAWAAALTGVYTIRLRARLKALRPDLVHTNSLKSALYGGLAAKTAGVPVVWHVHDRIATDYLPPAAVRLVKMCARLFPSALIANSEATRSTLGRVTKLTRVIANPIDVQPLDHVARDVLTVGVVGRLAPWKGQDLFLRAFAEAFPDGPEKAVIVGDALFGEEAYRHRLHSLAAELGVADRVEFRGFRDDISAELARIDVLVHSSTVPEPFGQVVVEGMAAGLSVVAAESGGPGEIIRQGVDGVLYPMGDQAALAAAMRRLAADSRLRERLGKTARTSAQIFTPVTIAGEVMDVYRQVLSDH